MRPLQLANGEVLFRSSPPPHLLSERRRNDAQPAINFCAHLSRKTVVYADRAGLAGSANEPGSPDALRTVRALAVEWLNATAHLSRLSRYTAHPNFDRLLRFGGATASFALDRLRQGDIQYHWLLLLKELNGVDPTRPEHTGQAKLQAQDWLDWFDGAVQS